MKQKSKSFFIVPWFFAMADYKVVAEGLGTTLKLIFIRER
jgi:hypothetical protein